MSIVSEPKHCPKCGGPIPAEAPQGLCPRCLLLQASIPTEAGRVDSFKTAPPTQEELAAAFPQLEILELIGRGGMGFVFKARQPKLERVVALKILTQSLAADPAFAERFMREGRMLARLNHPNIVTIHDFGHAGGFFFLLLEFVDGVNLRQAMKVGRFTPAQALAVVPKICEALQFAHNEGILHRDIKPENILLDAKGRVKIADFGIAKLIDEGRAEGKLTASGAALGTPHYMAPEQLEHPQDVDQRADIYSLGVVFYEMLTGELPIGRFAAPSRKSDIDPRLDDVVLRSLEKERQLRQPTAEELKTQVERITNHPAPAPVARAEGSDRFWRRFALAVLLLITLPVAIVVLAILAGITVPVFSKMRNREVQVPQQTAPALAISTPVSDSKLVIDAEQYTRDSSDSIPGRLTWKLKCFVPPDRLAEILFVVWSNGVPTIDPEFSSYYKVGKAGGIDVSYYSMTCERQVEASIRRTNNSAPAALSNDIMEKYQRLSGTLGLDRQNAWRYRFLTDNLRFHPDALAAQEKLAKTEAEIKEMSDKYPGLLDLVHWDVGLGLIYTLGSWKTMPPFHRVEARLPVSLRTGHQGVIPLLDFDQPEGVAASHGKSGVELRVILEPLTLPAIRLRPNEVEMKSFIGGSGLVGTMDEALKQIKTLPTDP